MTEITACMRLWNGCDVRYVAGTHWSTARTRVSGDKSPPHAAVSTTESRRQKNPICPITTRKVGHAISLSSTDRPTMTYLYSRRLFCAEKNRHGIVASYTDWTLIRKYCTMPATAFLPPIDLAYSVGVVPRGSIPALAVWLSKLPPIDRTCIAYIGIVKNVFTFIKFINENKF